MEEEYEVHTGEGGRYIQAPSSFIDAEGRMNPKRRTYQPLVQYPWLFLEFAHLAEDSGLDGGDELDTDKNVQVALGWAMTYGLLGLTLRKVGCHRYWADPGGGERDTVAAFAYEAWAANRALRLYEAAARSGGVDVETIVSLIPDPAHKESVVRYPEEAKGFALLAFMHELRERQPYYHTTPYWRETENLLPNGEFVQGWGFTNLLGCMWLQAEWLLYAGPDSVRRCKYPECNRIIVYEQPEKPLEHKKGERKKHKTHKNIKYCPEETGRHCRVKNYRMKKKLQP